MPDLAAAHIMLLALLTVIAAGLGWIVRGSRCAREKRAVNAGWQHQVDAQQSENDRLQDQNKGLMQQVNQHQASRRDASNRSRELAESLREAMDKRDELQRNVKELRAELAHAAGEHAAGEVGGEDGARTFRPVFEEGHGHVAGAAADVEDGRVRPGEDLAKAARRAPPPEPVNVGAEHVVEQVVARGDGVKHLPHSLRRGCFVRCAWRLGSG